MFRSKEFLSLLEKAIKSASALITIFLVSSKLQPQDFGEFSLIEGYCFLLFSIIVFGFQTVGNRILVDYDSSDCIRKIIKLRLLICLVLSVSSFAFFNLIDIKIINNLDVFLITLLLFYTVTSYRENISYHNDNYSEYIVDKILVLLFCFTLKLLSLFLFFDYIISVLIICFFMEVCPVSFVFWRKYSIVKEIEEKEKITYKEMSFLCFPTMLSSISIVIYSRFNQYLLAYFLPLSDVGAFSVLSRVSDLFVFLPTVIGALYLPRAYKLGITPKFIENYSRLIHIVAFVSFLFSVTLYGIYYSTAEEKGWLIPMNTAIFYQLTIFLNFIGMFVSQVQSYLGNPIHRMFRIVAGMIINISLSYFLIPVWGVNGVIVSILISLTISNLVIPALFKESWLIRVVLSSLLSFYRFRINDIKL
ncbi:oligosaccharide flippase family protein [Vibrio sp. 10N.237.312.B06]|uniref:oligosaccharide flippase family protein n=1 Tax=Vibrio sp. 10N.237.312.B06 TaxID=3229974 RepID=UPI003551AEF0